MKSLVYIVHSSMVWFTWILLEDVLRIGYRAELNRSLIFDPQVNWSQIWVDESYSSHRIYPVSEFNAVISSSFWTLIAHYHVSACNSCRVRCCYGKSICLSVCLSNASTVSKRTDILWHFFNLLVSTLLHSLEPQCHYKIPRGTPSTGLFKTGSENFAIVAFYLGNSSYYGILIGSQR